MKVVYPGSFDPFTLGHLDVLKRISRLYDEIVVLVSHSSKKSMFFSMEERVEMIKSVINNEGMKNIEVRMHKGLLVDFLHKENLNCIVRGLRAISDFEYELQMALMNRKMDRNIETIFLMTADEYSYISSTLVKEIAMHGGDLRSFVPEIIIPKIKEKVNDLR